ncbi:hypothetical protein BB558_000680 [Smittium angustum]|uniref:Mitochondrial-processing peptidase subunit alpha n=1 Tax=Smittium angustum TaxID=133377 RepID=A0A2U1JDW7_SMIAN|nr:hypothetical protein BB558_000680 [Smittium angustum]
MRQESILKQFKSTTSTQNTTAATNLKKDHIKKPPTTETHLVDNGNTIVSVLKNGIKVSSENKPGHFAALGVYIDVGSRYESPESFGASYLLDRLSFKSTENLSTEKVREKIEALGGNISCYSSRECMMYQAAVFTDAVNEAMQLLGESILRPKFEADEVAEVLDGISWEVADIKSKPEVYLPELFHEVAYKSNTLGNSAIFPEDQLSKITPELLKEFHKNWFSPERIVISAIGVDHKKLLEYCVSAGFENLPKNNAFYNPTNIKIQPTVHNKHSTSGVTQESTLNESNTSGSIISGIRNLFSSHPSSSQKPLNVASVSSNNLSTSTDTQSNDKTPLDSSTLENKLFVLANTQSKYTGGIKFIPDSSAEFTSLHLGFESVGVTDENKLYSYAALQMLLGGGGSFSAGGPGKGMYSRLYTRVLNQYGWVESCMAFHHCYSDSGLFGISASCRPGSEYQMLETVIDELLIVANHNSVKNRHSKNSRNAPGSFSKGRVSFGSSGDLMLTDLEIERAKNMLKSSLLMNMESRLIQLEDLGRQIQVLNKKVDLTEVCEKIDQISSEDISKAAADLFKSPVTILVNGKVEGLEKYGMNMLRHRGILIPE